MSNKEFDDIIGKQLRDEEVAYSDQEWRLFSDYRKKARTRKRAFYFFRKYIALPMAAAVLITSGYLGSFLVNTQPEAGTEIQAVKKTSPEAPVNGSSPQPGEQKTGEHLLSENNDPKTADAPLPSSSRKTKEENDQGRLARHKGKTTETRLQSSVAAANDAPVREMPLPASRILPRNTANAAPASATRRTTPVILSRAMGSVPDKATEAVEKNDPVSHPDGIGKRIPENTAKEHDGQKDDLPLAKGEESSDKVSGSGHPEAGNEIAGADTVKQTGQRILPMSSDSAAQQQPAIASEAPDSLSSAPAPEKIKRGIERMKPLYLFGGAALNTPFPNRSGMSSSGLGYLAGAGYRYDVMDQWGLGGTLAYCRRNGDAIIAAYDYNRYFLKKETYSQELRIQSSDWVSASVSIMRFSKSNRHCFIAGPVFSYLISTSGQIRNYTNGALKETKEVRNYVDGLQAFSAGAEIGYHYAFSRTVSVGIHYYKGLNDLTTSAEKQNTRDYYDGLSLTLNLGLK